jgi:predicted acyl esterase
MIDQVRIGPCPQNAGFATNAVAGTCGRVGGPATPAAPFGNSIVPSKSSRSHFLHTDCCVVQISVQIRQCCLLRHSKFSIFLHIPDFQSHTFTMPVPVQIAYKPISKPEIGNNNYQGFKPGESEVVKKGSKPYNGRPLESDIRIDHDVEIIVRDGCRLYADIYRPADAKPDEKLPAVVSWSCYGKKYSALHMLPMCVWNCCVPKEALSGLEKFEGLDPVVWCPRGYAIISVDSRGTGNCDGSIPLMGSQDAEDCYDVIEALAAMPWSNGKVGMAGNSALAIIQWHVASLRPPHLAAIAPWEGSGDLYREQFCRGGVFSMSNFDLITTHIIKTNNPGGGIEDMAEMYRRSPLSNAYWADKRPDMTQIECPVYISGSDFSSIHTMGSVRGWLEIPHDKKWIRWSPYQEWYELYMVDHSHKELMKYFDMYLKGVSNDWEKTPKVRWVALQFGDREATPNIANSTSATLLCLRSSSLLLKLSRTIRKTASQSPTSPTPSNRSRA